MSLLLLVSAVAVFFGTLLVGVAVHELSHALVLRVAGVSFTVEVLPGRSDSESFLWGLVGPLARVRPTRLPSAVSPWHLRTAAVMPFCLAIPFGLVFLGVIPDPFAADNLALELATIAWLACSIPSPRDFSLLWYPERCMAVYGDTASASMGRRTD